MEKFEIIKLNEINSTNLHATALLSENQIKTPTIIIADYQNQGKGQGGSKWESEAGKNLLFSIVIFPENIEPIEQFYLSKITSIAIRETLSGHTKNVFIKWPNDIIVNNEKIGGILIENSIENNKIRDTVIGIGINVNQTDFQSYSFIATSLKLLNARDFSPELLLADIITNFEFWFEKLEDRSFDQIDKEYFSFLYGFQKKLSFKKDDATFEATLVDVEKEGQLVLLMSNNKKQKFGFKELEFVV